jgi:hypothetical protein
LQHDKNQWWTYNLTLVKKYELHNATLYGEKPSREQESSPSNLPLIWDRQKDRSICGFSRSNHISFLLHKREYMHTLLTDGCPYVSDWHNSKYPDPNIAICFLHTSDKQIPIYKPFQVLGNLNLFLIWSNLPKASSNLPWKVEYNRFGRGKTHRSIVINKIKDKYINVIIPWLMMRSSLALASTLPFSLNLLKFQQHRLALNSSPFFPWTSPSLYRIVKEV